MVEYVLGNYHGAGKVCRGQEKGRFAFGGSTIVLLTEAGKVTIDEEYAAALKELAGGNPIQAVIVDPSAASFMEVLRRKGWRVKKAKNDVLSGIRLTSDCLKTRKIVICETCADCVREPGVLLFQRQRTDNWWVAGSTSSAMMSSMPPKVMPSGGRARKCAGLMYTPQSPKCLPSASHWCMRPPEA